VKAIEVWFEFASTYSYPAMMRIEPLARAAGVELRYRPFLLGPVFASQGLRDSPFNVFEAKGRYMWRDLERLCAAYELPFRKPSVFPRSGLLAARVALASSDAPWMPAFVRTVYTANFAEDRDITAAATIGALLGELGQDPEAVIARASTPANKQALKEQTDAAQERGIFGAPSFLVDGELFWGNDRLEQAIAWAAR
jgi:2-hydroxychromene-2-carboxylate isomerase